MDEYGLVMAQAAVDEMAKEAFLPTAVGRMVSRGVGLLRPAITRGATEAAEAGGKAVSGGWPTRESLARWAATPRGAEALERGVGRAASVGGGSALGAGVGAATAEEGQRLRGAAGGALLGAGAGLAVGQVATRAARSQLQRFGQRQLHGMTGYMPGHGVAGSGAKGTKWYQAGKAGKGKKLTSAERSASFEKMRMDVGGPSLAEAKKELAERATKGEFGKPGKLQDARLAVKARLMSGRSESARQGITSIPGFVKGLAPDRIKQTLTTGTAGGGVLGGGAMLAVTGAQAPHALAKAQGDKRPENVGRLIGEGIGYTAGAPIPIAGNLALGSLMGRVGGAIGKGVGKVTRLGRRETRNVPVQ